MKLTSRERFLISLIGGTPDRFFRYEMGPWPATAERWTAEAAPKGPVLPWEFSAPFFKMDPVARIRINSGYCDSPYEPKLVEKTLEDAGDYRVYIDSDGITKKVLKQNSDTSMPQFMKFPVENRNDWPEMLKRLNPDDTAARIGDPLKLVEAYSDLSVPNMLPICGVFGHPRNLLGDEGLAYTIFDDPALLEEILENWLALYRALIRALTETIRVDVLLIWEDMCYRNGPLISPEHFRQFMLPRYKELIGCARDHGIEAVIVDTDGDCLKMIPLFLEAGVDCLMPFEVQAGMDVVAIAKQYPRLSLMGGIDKRVLAGDDRKAIEAEVDRVLPFFMERGGYIPSLDHTVPPNVSLKNFQFYLKCVRRYEKL